MAAPSQRQFKSGSGTSSATATFATAPNVGNRMLAVISGSMNNSATRNRFAFTTGTWTKVDSVYSSEANFEVWYKDVEIGDTGATATDVDNTGYSFTLLLFELLDFTETPVLRDADITIGDSRIPTTSTSTNSFVMLTGFSNVITTWNTPTNYTPIVSSSYMYNFTATNEDLVSVTATITTHHHTALAIEIPETGSSAAGPVWDRLVEWEVSPSGDFSLLSTAVDTMGLEIGHGIGRYNITSAITSFDVEWPSAGALYTADSNYYQHIYVDPSVRHNGIDASTGARLVANTRNGMIVRPRWGAGYLLVEGLAFYKTSTTTSYRVLEMEGSSTVSAAEYTGNVVFDSCLFHNTGLTPTYDSGVYLRNGMSASTDTLVSFSNCVFHSLRRGAGIYWIGSSNFTSACTINVDQCTFGFNGEYGSPSGAGIQIESDFSSDVVVFNLNNNLFGDNINTGGVSNYADILAYNNNYGNSDGQITLNGSHNGLHYGVTLDSVDDVNNLTNTITAPNGFTADTTNNFGWIVGDTTTFGAYDLKLVAATTGTNLALAAGTNRVGSEPDPRQNFAVDALGNARPTVAAPDLGAFQLSAAGAAAAFKVWDGAAFVNSSAVKYYDGAAWVEVSAVQYWNGSAWADPS